MNQDLLVKQVKEKLLDLKHCKFRIHRIEKICYEEYIDWKEELKYHQYGVRTVLESGYVDCSDCLNILRKCLITKEEIKELQNG